jgi:hypothetical protein
MPCSAKYAALGTKVVLVLAPRRRDSAAMTWLGKSRVARAAGTALIGAALLTAPAVAADVELQPNTNGCNGVLPPNDGNTDMRLVGGTLTPGGTAVFEITYPLDSSDIGKEFTILACAFINDVAELKYIISYVPSNETYRLRMTFAVPEDAPVGGTYCNYTKTTRSPTAPQASQRKAGPTCFIIRPPAEPNTVLPPPTVPPPPTAPTAPPTSSNPPGVPLLPNTAMPQ